MSDGKNIDTFSFQTIEELRENLYNPDGSLCSSYLEQINHAIVESDFVALKKLVGSLHEAELADLLEELQPAQRYSFIQILGDFFNFTALTEVDNAVFIDVVSHLSKEQIAYGIQTLDSDDVVYFLEHFSFEDREKILELLPFAERIRVCRSLSYPEATAGRLMQTEFVSVSPFWTINEVIDHMRKSSFTLPERFNQIFVIDQNFCLMGTVELDKILRTSPTVLIADIMDTVPRTIPALLEQEEAAREFEKYNLLSAAVLDDENRLVGVLTIDDVVDIIQEEASEDLLRMGGVGNETLSDSIFQISRSRAKWLLVNLITAFIAAFVIDIFGYTIEKIVALAVLMPVVAGMGGNAGCQTMTVAVRALANKDLDQHNAGRIIRREVGVGFLNGLLFAFLISLVASLWFQNIDLGGIIAAAMIINMLAATFAGITIPLLLHRLGIDPAVASSVFVTTVTDIVGFISFLGLATWWFMIK